MSNQYQFPEHQRQAFIQIDLLNKLKKQCLLQNKTFEEFAALAAVFANRLAENLNNVNNSFEQPTGLLSLNDAN